MDTTTKAALEDLLQIRALSEVNPARVQMWQQAARTLLGAGEAAALDAVEAPGAPVVAKPVRPRHGVAPSD